MKKSLILIFISIILVSSVFALYTNETDSDLEGDVRITADIETNNSEIRKEIENRIGKAGEDAKKIMEQRREEIKNRIEKGLENSNLSEEEKQKIRNQIEKRINQSENMMKIKARNARNLTLEEKKELFQKRNRLQIRETAKEECPSECYCAGSTIRCWNQDRKEMTINAGKSGNTIVKTSGSNMSTNATLYHHDGRIFGKYKGNKSIAINYLPDDIDEKIRERVNAKIQERKIELDENDGNYTVQAKKRAKLFGMIPVKEKTEMKINPETGETLKEKNSWWGFLARDVKN